MRKVSDQAWCIKYDRKKSSYFKQVVHSSVNLKACMPRSKSRFNANKEQKPAVSNFAFKKFPTPQSATVMLAVQEK